MNKAFLICMITLTSLTSCSKHDSGMPRPSYYTPNNNTAASLPFTTMIVLHDCPIFVSDSTFTLQTMILACNAANFQFLNINIDTINENVYSVGIASDHGFATLWVDTDLDSCVLELFCADNTYPIEDFIGAFMTEFNSIEHKDDWFEELIEAWELDESIVTT